MKIAIAGTGYVGFITNTCLAEKGTQLFVSILMNKK